MSGSGPTVFGITKSREEATGLKRRVEKITSNGNNVLIVRTLDLKGVR